MGGIDGVNGVVDVDVDDVDGIDGIDIAVGGAGATVLGAESIVPATTAVEVAMSVVVAVATKGKPVGAVVEADSDVAPGAPKSITFRVSAQIRV